MPAIEIGFEWYRDRKGYDLRPHEVGKKTGGTVLGDGSLPERVARRGGKLAPYQPLRKGAFEDLYLHFMRLTNGKAVLDFVERFGPLTDGGLKAGGYDDVDLILQHADAMDAFLTIGVADAAAAAARISKVRDPLARLDIRLMADPATKSFKLSYLPRSLLSGLWLQAGQAIAGGAMVRLCRHCGQPFEAGTGRRRADALFCSAAHQATFKSLKRSKRSTANA